jgi:shikimate dehydrogenase
MDTVLQLGAGGAGAATAHAILKLGAGVLMISDTHFGRASALADTLNRRFGGRAVAVQDPIAAAARAQGLIQATPVGMDARPGLPIPIEAVRPDQWIYEVIYFPLETELLRRARAMGCRTVDGSAMAVFQAARAFELFTGVVPDAEAMARDLFDR